MAAEAWASAGRREGTTNCCPWGTCRTGRGPKGSRWTARTLMTHPVPIQFTGKETEAQARDPLRAESHRRGLPPPPLVSTKADWYGRCLPPQTHTGFLTARTSQGCGSLGTGCQSSTYILENSHTAFKTLLKHHLPAPPGSLSYHKTTCCTQHFTWFLCSPSKAPFYIQK